MAAGIKILSMMMSLIIVSISEITPWVFSNADASKNSVMLDAACFDSVLSIPSESLFSNEIVEQEVVSTTEITPEIIVPSTDAAEVTLPEVTTEVVSEIVSEETSTEVEETTEAETETITEAETETETKKDILSDKILISSDDMIWPVSHQSEVVEGFPRYSSGSAHHGIDIFVINSSGSNRNSKGDSLSYGKPFRAAKSGVVVEAANDDGYHTGYGNYCIIDHGDGTQTLYAHARAILVETGDSVMQGQTIGEIGGTGNTTAPHLHFEVRVKGQRVDPLNYVSEP